MHIRNKVGRLISYLKTLDYFFVSVLLVAALLRFVDLGYSDYQGDEIKAFYSPSEGQGIGEFLLSQRKGPLQFLITFITKYISADYSNRFISRLPFALAGFFAVFFFYKFVKLLFGKKAAFLSSFFLATNGFLIAFSRIVQYQSLVIFFMILALYLLTLSLKYPKYKHNGLFWSLIAWAMSILAHYDGVFIAPFMFYLLMKWFQQYYRKDPKGTLLAFAASSLIPVFMLGLFYLPYFMSIAATTISYWQGRISGEVSGKISSSKYLFQVYQPIYTIHIYTMLAILGALYVLYRVYVEKRLTWDFRFLALWIGLPLLFMEVFVSVPGTHIYTYLIPLTIVMAFGTILIQNIVLKIFKERFGSIIFQTCVVYIFLFIFAQVYAIYVDNRSEYPWETEKFFFWEFHKPTPTYHLSMFGFPYNRNWDGIRKYILSFPDVTYYSTNERGALVRYYIPLLKDANKAGFYVYIRNPQTFTNSITHEKVVYWMENHEPLYIYSRNGEDLASIYLMPPLKLRDVLKIEQPNE